MYKLKYNIPDGQKQTAMDQMDEIEFDKMDQNDVHNKDIHELD